MSTPETQQQTIERLHQLTLGASRDLQYAKRKLAEAQAKFEAAACAYNAYVLEFCSTEDVI